MVMNHRLICVVLALVLDCGVVTRSSSSQDDSGCVRSTYGCCPDRVTRAADSYMRGCPGDVTTKTKGLDCFMKEDEGDCDNWSVAFGYNVDEGRCKQFWYGGCGGNNNRFLANANCEQRCMTISDSSRCFLPQGNDTRSCEDTTKIRLRWMFNPHIRICEQYAVSCPATSNDFSTLLDCQVACGEAYTQDVCKQPQHTSSGSCNKANQYAYRYVYEEDTQSCKRVYSCLIDINGNNFRTELDCLKRCNQVAYKKIVGPSEDRLTTTTSTVPPTSAPLTGQTEVERCIADVSRSPCLVTPLCGSDGQTYYDECKFEQEKCFDPELSKAYDEECTDVTEGGGRVEVTLVTCSKLKFRCDVDNSCIPNERTCDGRNDCSDGSDEKVPNCPQNDDPATCGEYGCCPGTQTPASDSKWSTCPRTELTMYPSGDRPARKKARSGGRVLLTCRVSGAPKPDGFVWYIRDSQGTFVGGIDDTYADISVASDGSSIIIDPIPLNDFEREYGCRAYRFGANGGVLETDLSFYYVLERDDSVPDEPMFVPESTTRRTTEYTMSQQTRPTQPPESSIISSMVTQRTRFTMSTARRTSTIARRTSSMPPTVEESGGDGGSIDEGETDCKDGFRCESDRRCLRIQAVCDGIVDCRDESDERYCSSSGRGGEIPYPDEESEEIIDEDNNIITGATMRIDIPFKKRLVKITCEFPELSKNQIINYVFTSPPPHLMEISSGDYIWKIHNVLNFEKFLIRHQGTYKCEAKDSNMKLLARKDIILKIKEFVSEPTVSGHLQRFKKSSTIEIDCAASGYPSPITYRFSKGNQLLYNNERISIVNTPSADPKSTKGSSGQLVIKKANKNDRGNYTCTAVSATGIVRKNRAFRVRIKIKAPVLPAPDDSCRDIGRELVNCRWVAVLGYCRLTRFNDKHCCRTCYYCTKCAKPPPE